MTEEPSGWQKHEKSEHHGSRENTVSVRGNGEVNIHRAEWKKHATDERYVDVYFRPAADELGVMPVHEPGPDSYSLGETGAFSCVSVWNRLGIDTPEEITYLRAEWNGQIGMWTVDVSPLREDNES